MSEIEKHNVRLHIEQIIERSRFHDERFLIDSKVAAADILQFLQAERFISIEQSEINQP